MTHQTYSSPIQPLVANQRGYLINAVVLSSVFILLASLNGQSDFLAHVNLATYQFFAQWQQPLLTAFFQTVTVLGNKFFLASMSWLLASWLLYRRFFYTGLQIAAVTLVSMMVIGVLKHSLQVARPEQIIIAQDSWSFPSGHTALATALYGYLAVLLYNWLQRMNQRNKRFYRGLIVLIVSFLLSSIAISRLYLGVHWLTDILGGILVGAALCMSASYVYFRYQPVNYPL